MDRGYIKVWRKIQDWEWYKDTQTFGFFVYLMMEANYKDSRYMGFEIPRGALVCGRKRLSEDLGLSERTVRTLLTRLKSTNEITIKTTSRFSIVYIANYNKYQDKTTNETTIKTTNERPATDQQPTTSKEVKKERIKDNGNFLEELKATYPGISIETELTKMRGWLLTNPNRKLTKKFAVNWINRYLENNKEVSIGNKPESRPFPKHA